MTLKKITIIVAILATLSFSYWLLNKRTIIETKECQSTNTIFYGAQGGYESNCTETGDHQLKIHGTLPGWLEGALVRVGPAQFELGETQCKYWFDGFAKLYRWQIGNGTVSYSSAFLDTEYRRTALKTGKMSGAQQKKSSIFAKLGNALRDRPVYDNASIAPAVIAGQPVCLTASPVAVAFDQSSLKTIGHVAFDDNIDAHASTAHPITDVHSGDFFNILVEYGSTTQYHLTKMSKGSHAREIIASYKTKKPSFIHSFALTDRYAIIAAIPFIVNPADMLFEVKPYFDYFSWRPELGTTFVVIDKSTGALVGEYGTDAFFCFNQINAFEKDDSLILDMITYPDANVIETAQLAHLRAHPESFAQSSAVERFSINITTGKIERTMLPCGSLELPTINEAYRCKPYRYLYGVKPGFSALCKLDLQTSKTIHWSHANCYPGEPIFVAKPGAKLEDDGILISVVFDARIKKSFLLFLHARDLKECARAEMQEALPFNFHGIFINK
jgi:carotenoid cleavage dioxygenase-like enzyme